MRVINCLVVIALAAACSLQWAANAEVALEVDPNGYIVYCPCMGKLKYFSEINKLISADQLIFRKIRQSGGAVPRIASVCQAPQPDAHFAALYRVRQVRGEMSLFLGFFRLI